MMLSVNDHRLPSAEQPRPQRRVLGSLALSLVTTLAWGQPAGVDISTIQVKDLQRKVLTPPAVVEFLKSARYGANIVVAWKIKGAEDTG